MANNPKKRKAVTSRKQAALNEAVREWLVVYEDGNRMDTPDGAVVRCGLGMAARRFFRATRRTAR
jgi:hypothetical protein